MSPPRGDAGARRAAILDAALSLFGRYGYRRTSIDDIAREAGIAKGTVYLSFRSKDQVFRALSESLVERMLAAARAASEGPGPVERRLLAVAEAWFGTYFETIRRSPHAEDLIDSKHQLSSGIVLDGSRQFRRLVIHVIEEAEQSGDLRLDRFGLGAEAAADLLIAAARGLESGTDAPESFHQGLADAVRVMVAGLRAGPSNRSRPAD